jgi:hypothetical protein
MDAGYEAPRESVFGSTFLRRNRPIPLGFPDANDRRQLWGTIENAAKPFKGASRGRVFKAVRAPQAHQDRMVSCARLVIALLLRVASVQAD